MNYLIGRLSVNELRFILLGILYIGIFGMFIESIIIFRRWKNMLQGYLILNCIATLVNIIGYLMELNSKTKGEYLIALKLSYAGRIWIGFTMFLFVAQLTRANLFNVLKDVLIGFHLMVYLTIFTIGKHRLYYSGIYYETGRVFPTIRHGNGIFHHLFLGIQFLLIICGLSWIFRALYRERNRKIRKRFKIVIAAILSESGFFMIQIIGVPRITDSYDLTMIGYMIGTILMLIAILSYDLFGTKELAKEFVIDRISEGIIAVDENGTVQYFNEPAAQLYPELAGKTNHLPEEIRRAVDEAGQIIRADRIYIPEENDLVYEEEIFGKLYVLVDETEHILYMNELQHQNEIIEKEVERQTKRSKRLSKEMMLVLSKTVDIKDHYTDGHSRRVAALCAEIGRRLGKSDEEQVRLYEVGLLHDIGKIGIHEDIIHKNTRLSDEEFRMIQNHTVKGYEILKEIRDMPILCQGARWHHERFDGSGYPDGLKGNDIPEFARIACIADCYDAMTSTRTYSVPKRQEDVRAEIVRCRGKWFDPQITDIMLEMIDEDTDYHMNEKSDGSDVWKKYERLWGSEEFSEH